MAWESGRKVKKAQVRRFGEQLSACVGQSGHCVSSFHLPYVVRAGTNANVPGKVKCSVSVLSLFSATQASDHPINLTLYFIHLFYCANEEQTEMENGDLSDCMRQAWGIS